MELTGTQARLRNKRLYLALKRIMDIVGGIAGLVLFGPLILLFAIVIKLTSAGPAFFAQSAIGKNGRHFKMFKLRTMYHGSDNSEHQRRTADFVRGDESEWETDARTGRSIYKIVNDPRVTRVGQFLRHHALDEAPQFLNVIKGDMSLVGPRPPLPYEYSLYDDWTKQRVAVRPGITGPNQVYKRSSATFKEAVETDLEYIHNISLWLDLKLILLTIPFVSLLGRGAY